MEEKDNDPWANPQEWNFWEFILFVAGKDIKAQTARTNLEEICKKHLNGRYHIEIIDIKENPEKAIAYDIIATPTLLRQRPKPILRILGSLSPATKVIEVLDIS